MKNKNIIKLLTILIVFLYSLPLLSSELIYLSVVNRRVEDNVFKADLLMQITDHENNWDISAATIVLQYNVDAISPESFNFKSLTNISSELADAGVYVNQTKYSTGKTAINIFLADNKLNINKKIVIGTINFDIINKDLKDNIKIDAVETVIYTELKRLQAVCETSSCWNYSDTYGMAVNSLFLTPPVLIAPADMSFEIEPGTAIEWTQVPEAQSYKIQIATDPYFNNVIVEENFSGTIFTFSGMAEEQQYFWRVKAINSIMESDWPALFEFSTGMDTGIRDNISNSEIILYPNPAEENVFIKANMTILSLSDFWKIEIVNQLGSVIFSSKINPGEEIKIQSSDFPNGLYYVRSSIISATQKIKTEVKPLVIKK